MADRLKREGLPHGCTRPAIDGSLFHIDFPGPTGGSKVTVYGQQQVTRELFAAVEAKQVPIRWHAADASPQGFDGVRSSVTRT